MIPQAERERERESHGGAGGVCCALAPAPDRQLEEQGGPGREAPQGPGIIRLRLGARGWVKGTAELACPTILCDLCDGEGLCPMVPVPGLISLLPSYILLCGPHVMQTRTGPWTRGMMRRWTRTTTWQLRQRRWGREGVFGAPGGTGMGPWLQIVRLRRLRVQWQLRWTIPFVAHVPAHITTPHPSSAPDSHHPSTTISPLKPLPQTLTQNLISTLP